MIIYDLHILGSGEPFGPFEANPRLVVDADTVLALAVPFERFKTVTGQCGEVLKPCRCFHSLVLAGRL